MARYRGPKTKIARRFKEPIFGPSKAFDRKKQATRQGRGRRKPSDYAVQLNEKQKAKYLYGLLERQFRNTFKKAAAKKGVTGEVFLQLLESRLDNTIYRMGFAPTRRAARQIVVHKHVRLNGRTTNVPSVLLKPGDMIEIREKSRHLEIVNQNIGTGKRFPWLDINGETYSGVFLNYPDREEIPENIKENLIVELYSK